MEILPVDLLEGQALSQLQQVKPTVATERFTSLILEGVQDTAQSLNTADALIQRVALGKPVPTHEVVMAMEKAKLQLTLLVEVRNKVVEGYQEILRMQV